MITRLQGYAIKGYGPRLTSGNRFAVITIQYPGSYCTLVQLSLIPVLIAYSRTDITGLLLFDTGTFLQNCTLHLSSSTRHTRQTTENILQVLNTDNREVTYPRRHYKQENKVKNARTRTRQ